MKATVFFISVILGSILLTSCSSDDNNSSDIIIGKWVPIEKYESDVQVSLSTCEPYIYLEYRSDKSILSDRVITSQLPQECELLMFIIGRNWSNLGNNQYRIRFLDDPGEIRIYYKDGENLVEELPDGITKYVYEPYEL